MTVKANRLILIDIPKMHANGEVIVITQAIPQHLYFLRRLEVPP